MKTITIPLELAEKILDIMGEVEYPLDAEDELESLIKAQRLIDNLSLAQQTLNDAPVSAKNRILRDFDPRDIAVGLFDNNFVAKYLNKSKGDNHG